MAGLVASAIPWNLIAKLAGLAALVAIGFGAGVSYEHKAPWALGGQLSRLEASIPQLTAKAAQQGAAAQAGLDKGAFSQWSTQLQQCRAAATATRDTAAKQIATTDAYSRAQVSSAYQMGRAICGATNAKTPPGPAAAGAAVSVRDDGDDFAAIFDPAAFTASGQAPLPAAGDSGGPPGTASP